MGANSSLSIRAELAGLRKDFQAATGMEEAEAQRLIISLERRLKSAENASKAAAKASKDAAKAAGDLSKNLGAVQQVASTLPAPLGQVASMGVNLTKGLGQMVEAVGVVGIGLAAIGTAALAGGAGLVKLAVDLEENVAELKKLGLATAEESAMAEKAKSASDKLHASWTELKTVLGEQLSPAVTDLKMELVDLLDHLDELVKGKGSWAAAFRGATGQGSGMTLSEWLSGSATAEDAGNLAADANRAANQDASGPAGLSRAQSRLLSPMHSPSGSALDITGERSQQEQMLALGMASPDAIVDNQVGDPKKKAAEAAAAAKKASDAAELARKQAVEGIEAELAATKSLEEMTQGYFADSLDGESALAVAHGKRLKQIQELEDASQDAAAADAARAAEQIRYEKELFSLRQQQQDELDSIMNKRVEDQKQTEKDHKTIAIESAKAIGDSAQTLLGIYVQQAEAQDHLSAKQKRAALAAFRGGQALALAQIAFGTATAVATDLKLPFPLDVLAIAADVATGVAQGATVASQKPPQFPGGGVVPPSVLNQRTSPDHGLVAASPGEGIVNRAGMDDIGPEGLAAINGRRGRRGGTTYVMPFIYRHKVYDRFITDNLAKGGPLKRALLDIRKPGHSNRA